MFFTEHKYLLTIYIAIAIIQINKLADTLRRFNVQIP